MGFSCAACTKSIRTSQHIKCSKCSRDYHQLCVNFTSLVKLSEELKLTWICPFCKAAEPKKDNTNTPIRVSVSCSDEPVQVMPRITTRKIAASAPVSPLLSVADSESLFTMVTEMKLLREDVGEIKSQMKSLTEHITNCNSRLDEYEKNLTVTLDRLHVVEERTSIIISLENEITQLREQQKLREQSYLKNEIEISGVNESLNENPMHIIRVIGHKIGIPLDDKDLDFATRVGPLRRDEEGTTTDGSFGKQPRPLVIRFLRRHQRDAFLKVGKSKRNLNCADIEVAGARRNIYFNERLTQEKRHLFRSARHRCKGAGYKYCWIKNGSVFVRKQEGNPAINIKNMDDLLLRVYSAPLDQSQQ